MNLFGCGSGAALLPHVIPPRARANNVVASKYKLIKVSDHIAKTDGFSNMC